MKVRLVVVGKVKEKATRALVDEYVGRIRHYCQCEEVELKAGPKLSSALARATAGCTVIALEIEGDAFTSKVLAKRFEGWASRGKGIVAFVIGGADGIPIAFSRQVHQRWSLSRLTFPHRLARVIVAEQVYRALTILGGEPYDH